MGLLTRFVKRIFVKVTTGELSLNFGEHNRVITDQTLSPKVDSTWSTEKKVSHLLDELTLEEKINLLGGEDTFAISSIERLGLSRVWCTDASSGVRTYGRSTAFPAFVALTASWNRDLLRKVGGVIAEECRAKGISILLAPGTNLYRVPTNGRNFEYMGEDPHLASELVVPYIKAVQSRGVITTVKHFVANNSDYDRHKMDTIVDERTLHELYYPAFKAAIQEGKSKGIMCAYNLLNGIHCSEHKELLTSVLRDEWGFDGFVISDWDCLYSTEGPMKAGLDLEMPYGKYYSETRIKTALESGTISMDDIDSKVRNLLHSFFEMGIYTRKMKDETAIEFGDDHDAIALEAARESVILLKNEGNLLPLNPDKEQKIVVLGRNAHPTPTSGGGSCFVHAHNAQTIYESLQSIAGTKTDIRLVTHKKDRLSSEIKTTIKQADYVVACVGFSHYEESEAWDRPWPLIDREDKLIQAISSLNKNTIVVLNAGGGIETESWIHGVPSFIHSFYMGQSAGTPVGEIIFGKTNPSGKLPFTMAKQWSDFASTQNYVDKPDQTSVNQIRQVTKEKNRFRAAITLEYNEKLMVGYRHFDTQDIQPQFAFGHGLSYTTFEYSDLELDKDSVSDNVNMTLSFKIRNVGNYAGKEVVQCYIRHLNPRLTRPNKELKDFVKVHLEPQEENSLSFTITPDSLAFYDPKKHKWVTEAGDYEVLIGSSSRDIRLKMQFKFQ